MKNTHGVLYNRIADFFKSSTTPGIFLLVAMVLSFVAENTDLRPYYDALLETRFSIHLGEWGLDKPLLLWINDGLMAVFFLYIGLEVKKEILTGHLSSRERFTLPAVAALGGLLVPVLVYIAFNYADNVTRQGWAIPAATDIAFSLGILMLLGKRVPHGLIVCLMALATIDDLATIVIIAVFYTYSLSFYALAVAGLMTLILFIFNRMRVMNITAYLLVGAVLWIFLLKSGVHATLAGVIIAFMVPMSRPGEKRTFSPLHALEHDIRPMVNLLIMPIFAFANAGISFTGLTWEHVFNPVSLGIGLGLFFGKQAGVMGATWISCKIGICRLPEGVNWAQYYGMSVLAGIGFTMSLFIGGLAFETTEFNSSIRIGVLSGSFLSAALGIAILCYVGRERKRGHKWI